MSTNRKRLDKLINFIKKDEGVLFCLLYRIEFNQNVLVI